MSRERIMVLEDDPDLRELTREVLDDAGYMVETFGSGTAAIDAVRLSAFDLILSDVYLPDISGIEVFQQIRSLRPEMAGVAMTGFSNWQLAMDAVRAGFTGFLVKPVPPEQLISAVTTALDQEKLQRENARLRALVPLYELSRMFIGTNELAEVLQQIVQIAREETRADVVSLMLIEEDGRGLSIAAASGLLPKIVESQRSVVGSGIAGWVAEHGEPLMIAEGIPLDPELRKAMGKPDVLSALSLPLTARGEVIGVLNLARLRGGEPFTRGDLELASVLAGQAAIAIEKARLIDDLRALSETSQRLASALDLHEAASIVVETTTKMAHARRAALWLVEDVSDQFALYKTFNFEPEELRQLPLPDMIGLTSGEQITEREGASILWLPISRADKKFGVLELHLLGAQPPRPDRLGILRTLAHTAAAVIESHRLRAREVIAFRELDSAVRSDLELREVLERVLNQMVEACSAHGGAIFLAADNGQPLDAWVKCGLEPPAALASQVVHDNQPILLASLSVPGALSVRSLIGAPLAIGGRVEGAVVLTHHEPAAFAMRHLNLLSVLSTTTALIVRNAELYAHSEEAAIAEERTRIAREIHDGLAQDLSFLILKVELMRQLLRKGEHAHLDKELTEMTAALRNDVREVRRTIFALRPFDLESLGFLPALEKFTNEYGRANEIKVHSTRTGDAGNLSPKLQIALFRLMQESLNNIRKHARASNIWIELEFVEHWAILRVRDDGLGFKIEEALPEARRRGSVGMIQMRERAERAGGSFLVETGPGKGTTIQVMLPVK